jgi:hypothetical protein
VTLRAQRDTRVVRGLHRHPAIRSGVRRFGSPLNATRTAGQGSNPVLVFFVACGTLARRSGAWADALALRQLAPKDYVGKVRLQLFSGQHGLRKEREDAPQGGARPQGVE